MTDIDSGTIQCKPRGKPGPKGGTVATKEVTGLCVGRDKVVVVPEEVQKLAALGCRNHEIADFFGITGDALTRHFAAQLVKGREEMKITLRRAMLNNACTNMNAAVQIFLAKNLLGMSDNGLVNDDEKQPLPWSDE